VKNQGQIMDTLDLLGKLLLLSFSFSSFASYYVQCSTFVGGHTIAKARPQMMLSRIHKRKTQSKMQIRRPAKKCRYQNLNLPPLRLVPPVSPHPLTRTRISVFIDRLATIGTHDDDPHCSFSCSFPQPRVHYNTTASLSLCFLVSSKNQNSRVFPLASQCFASSMQPMAIFSMALSLVYPR